MCTCLRRQTGSVQKAKVAREQAADAFVRLKRRYCEQLLLGLVQGAEAACASAAAPRGSGPVSEGADACGEEGSGLASGPEAVAASAQGPSMAWGGGGSSIRAQQQVGSSRQEGATPGGQWPHAQGAVPASQRGQASTWAWPTSEGNNMRCSSGGDSSSRCVTDVAAARWDQRHPKASLEQQQQQQGLPQVGQHVCQQLRQWQQQAPAAGSTQDPRSLPTFPRRSDAGASQAGLPWGASLHSSAHAPSLQPQPQISVSRLPAGMQSRGSCRDTRNHANNTSAACAPATAAEAQRALQGAPGSPSPSPRPRLSGAPHAPSKPQAPSQQQGLQQQHHPHHHHQQQRLQVLHESRRSLLLSHAATLPLALAPCFARLAKGGPFFLGACCWDAKDAGGASGAGDPGLKRRSELACLQVTHWLVCLLAGGLFYRLVADGLRAYRWVLQAASLRCLSVVNGTVIAWRSNRPEQCWCWRGNGNCCVLALLVCGKRQGGVIAGPGPAALRKGVTEKETTGFRPTAPPGNTSRFGPAGCAPAWWRPSPSSAAATAGAG